MDGLPLAVPARRASQTQQLRLVTVRSWFDPEMSNDVKKYQLENKKGKKKDLFLRSHLASTIRSR